MKIIIVGCGRMGSGLAQVLNLRGHDLMLIDRDPTAFARLGPKFTGKTLTGIGFDREVLLQAGIARADGLAAVTGSDEVNVVVARLARLVFHVPRVVARLYDPRKAEIYRRLGLRTISPVGWGIDRLAESLVFAELDAVFSLGSGVEIVEVEAPGLVVGRSVQDLTAPGEVQVVAIHRRGRSFLPAPTTVFEDGDVLHLAVATAAVDRLKGLLGVM